MAGHSAFEEYMKDENLGLFDGTEAESGGYGRSPSVPRQPSAFDPATRHQTPPPPSSIPTPGMASRTPPPPVPAYRPPPPPPPPSGTPAIPGPGTLPPRQHSQSPGAGSGVGGGGYTPAGPSGSLTGSPARTMLTTPPPHPGGLPVPYQPSARSRSNTSMGSMEPETGWRQRALAAETEVGELRRQLERSATKLRQQEEELAASEAKAAGLHDEVQALRSRQGAADHSMAELQILRERTTSLQAEVDRHTQSAAEKEAVLLEAYNALQKVQEDADATVDEVVTVMKKLLPSETPEVDDVPALVRRMGRKLEDLLQSTLDKGAQQEARAEQLEKEIERLRASEAQARAECVRLKETAAIGESNTEAMAKVSKLQIELDMSRRRASELTDEITKLQSELAEYRAGDQSMNSSHIARIKAVYDVSAAELHEKIREVEEALRRKEQQCADEARQRRSQAELLQRTEEALRRCEEELERARQAKGVSAVSPAAKVDAMSDRSSMSPVRSFAEPEMVQGELWKLSSGAKPTWKKRYFVADKSCLQYFAKQEDYLRRDYNRIHGVRLYRNQHAFVSRFTASLGSEDTVDPATGVSRYHDKASDPNCYYFGFVPKSESALNQVFLLRTDSKEQWYRWCSYISKQFNPGLWRQAMSHNTHEPPHEMGTQTTFKKSPEDLWDMAPGVFPANFQSVASPPPPSRPSFRRDYDKDSATFSDTSPTVHFPYREATPPDRPGASDRNRDSYYDANAVMTQTAATASIPRSTQTFGIVPPEHDRRREGYLTDDALRDELRKAEEALRAMAADQEPMRARIAAAEEKIERLNGAATAKDREIDRLKGELKSQKEVAERFKEDLDNALEDLESANKQMAALREGMAISKAEVTRLRVELQDKRWEDLQAVKDSIAPPSTPPRTRSTVRKDSATSPPSALRNTLREGHDTSLLSDLEGRLREAVNRNQQLAKEQKEVTDQLRTQEAQHDAQISAFCDQVLRDMDAIKKQSQEEIDRRDKEWRKEVSIWQQLVSEKEQQIAMATHKGYPADDLDDIGEQNWKIVGGGRTSAPPVVLAMKLTAMGGDDAEPRTYGTRIAVDRRNLTQVSVSDESQSKENKIMNRTWKFASVHGDNTTVILSLCIMPSLSVLKRTSSNIFPLTPPPTQPAKKKTASRGATPSKARKALSFATYY